MGGFTGRPAAAVEFSRGLEADDSKAYWAAHRAQYHTPPTASRRRCAPRRR